MRLSSKYLMYGKHAANPADTPPGLEKPLASKLQELQANPDEVKEEPQPRRQRQHVWCDDRRVEGPGEGPGDVARRVADMVTDRCVAAGNLVHQRC